MEKIVYKLIKTYPGSQNKGFRVYIKKKGHLHYHHLHDDECDGESYYKTTIENWPEYWEREDLSIKKIKTSLIKESFLFSDRFGRYIYGKLLDQDLSSKFIKFFGKPNISNENENIWILMHMDIRFNIYARKNNTEISIYLKGKREERYVTKFICKSFIIKLYNLIENN